MESDTIFDFLDAESRIRAFSHYFSKLEAAKRLDFDALRVCIRLRAIKSDGSLSTSSSNLTPSGQLINILLLRIPQEPQDTDHIYKLAEVLLNDGDFARSLLRERLRDELLEVLPQLSRTDQDEAVDGARTQGQLFVRKATGYLNLLRCCYWLPSSRSYVVDSTTLKFLSRFLGRPETDGIAHGAVSALLSLLKQGGHSQRSPLSDDRPPVLVDQSLWDRYRTLGLDYFDSGSQIFGTWFQWISQAALDGVTMSCLKEDLYWDRVRYGLLNGYADQRKYCIGIIRQSLLAAQFDISTPTMQFRIRDCALYLKIYEQYSGLFETVVLNRYANQVQACLPELTKLLQSDITPVMATTLLSAALNPMVQEGVRKLIGTWYATYVVTVSHTIVSFWDIRLLSKRCIDLSTALQTCGEKYTELCYLTIS